MKRKSDHLKNAPKGTEPCRRCGGTGWEPGGRAGETCHNCRGWGY